MLRIPVFLKISQSGDFEERNFVNYVPSYFCLRSQMLSRGSVFSNTHCRQGMPVTATTCWRILSGRYSVPALLCLVPPCPA